MRSRSTSTPPLAGSPQAMYGKRPEDLAAGALALSLLRETVAAGARRLHLEPAVGGGLVARMRGARLRPGPCPPVPPDLGHHLLRQLKARAGMDPAESRIPQEGTLVLQRPDPDGPVILRLSTLPTSRGEAMVVEVTPDLQGPRELGALGLDPSDLPRVAGALAGGGLVLAVGPLGAGKGTLLRACLRHVARESERTAYTLDPAAEHEVPGAVTLRLNPEIHVTETNLLRCVLRTADPDVVHVTLLRDLESGELIVDAAAAGRLLLAGMFAEDAPSAVLRLLDLGLPSYLITGSLQAIVSCRTLPRLCDACKVATPALDADDQRRLVPRLVDEEVLTGWQRAFVARRGGCADCGGTGHSGRIGVYEVVDRVGPLVDVVVRGDPTTIGRDALASTLHARTRTLRESAVLCAAEGLVAVVDALRATPVAPGAQPPRSRPS